MRNFLLRGVAVVLGFMVAFGLAEAAVRIFAPQVTGPPRFAFDPELGEIPVPLQTGRQVYPGVYDFTYTNNSLGFRGKREFGPKPPGVWRIFLLGDSFTYGVGVNDDQTFAFHLERYLRERGIAAEVINGGTPGKGTDYELKLFRTVGVKLQPDLTVLCFFANDFEDNYRGEYYYLDHGELREKALDRNQGLIKTVLYHFPGYNWLISWSQAANLVKQAAVNYLVKSGPDEGHTGAAAGLVVSYAGGENGYVNDRNRKLTAMYVEHLEAAVKQAGSGFLVFYIPVAADVETYRRQQKISRDEQAITEIVEAGGGTLRSFVPVLAASGAPMGELYYADGHWTARAHLLAARFMAEKITAVLPEQHRIGAPTARGAD